MERMDAAGPTRAGLHVGPSASGSGEGTGTAI
jgi:hypothetical protein